MDRPQFNSLVVLHVKVIYCMVASFSLTTLTALNVLEAHFRFASLSSVFALLLAGYAAFLLIYGLHKSHSYFEWILVGLLAIFTLFGMQQNTQVVHWIYFVPTFVFLAMPIRLASWMLLLYSAVLLWVILNQFPANLHVQMIFTYLACVTFSSLYALINERSIRGLDDHIDTDPLTNVYSERQLTSDLKKEITRAVRQGSLLFVIRVSIPQVWRQLKLENYELRLGYFGGKLNRCLRKYDTCYRIANDEFIIVMPDTTVEDGERLQENLMDDLTGSDRYEALTDITIQLAEYMPGDNVQSLMKRVQQPANGELREEGAHV